MSATEESKANLTVVYTELCNSYRAIDDFRAKLLSLLPLATGGLFFFVTNPEKLITGSDKSSALPNEIVHAIGLFGVLITLGLFCYELYGIRKCTALIFLGKSLEIDLGDIKGQFTLRPDGILYGYLGDSFKFIAINEPFAAGIIYPAVMAAWTYVALFRNDIAPWLAISVFLGMFAISMIFMRWLVKYEIPELMRDLNLPRSVKKVGEV